MLSSILLCQEIQNNRLGEQMQPSATYWQSSTRPWWPKRFKGMVMAVLAQFWSERVAIFTENSSREQLIVQSSSSFSFKFCFVYYAVVTSSRLLRYYYWPIKVEFYFSADSCETHIWLVDSYTIWDKFAQVYSLTTQNNFKHLEGRIKTLHW